MFHTIQVTKKIDLSIITMSSGNSDRVTSMATVSDNLLDSKNC